MLDLEAGRTRSESEEEAAVERLLQLARAIRFLNEKWNVDLLILLNSKGALRFNTIRDLCKSTFGGNISTRTLSTRLTKMQKRHLVDRRSYPESPPRVEYSLTDDGREFAHSIIQAIIILNTHMKEEYWNDIDPAMRNTIQRGRSNLVKRMEDPQQRDCLLSLYRSLPRIDDSMVQEDK